MPERSGCLPGVERELKGLESAFNTHWNNRDAISFGALWSEQGDLVHGDGTIERGQPQVVVFPDTAAEVAAAVKIARRYDLPVVPRGAGITTG